MIKNNFSEKLKHFQPKSQEVIQPKRRFLGRMLESRKKIQRERKKALEVDIQDLL